MSNWSRIFVTVALCAGLYAVIQGGVTKEEEHLFYAFAGAILLVFGFIKWDSIMAFLGARFQFLRKADEPKGPPSA